MSETRPKRPNFNTDDPVIVGSWPAMLRAARKAREISIQMGTPFFVMDSNGRIVDLNAKKKVAARNGRRASKIRRGHARP